MKGKDKIFIYFSARDFLKVLYQNQKSMRRRYSYPVFSKELGLSGTTHLYQFLMGTKELSENSIQTIAKTLKLNKKSSTYFDLLVQMDQSQETLLRSSLLNRIIKLRADEVESDIDEATKAYLSEYSVPLVRELVELPGFKADPKWITEKIGIEISLKQATNAWNILQKYDFIQFDLPTQKWVQKDIKIRLPDGTASSILSRLQSEILDLAKEAIWTNPDTDRDIASAMLGIEEAQFSNLKQDLENARQDILDKYQSKNPDIIIAFASQVFKLTSGGKQ